MNANSIEHCLSLSEDALLAEIGRQTEQAALHMGAKRPTLDELRQWGAAFFTRYEKQLRVKICTDARVQRHIVSNHRLDDVHLALLIAEIILEPLHGVHPYILSAVVLKRGLVLWCNH